LGNLGSWFLVLGNLRFKTKNQDLLKSLWGIVVLGSWFWGILDLKPRTKNQDLLRSLWGILVLGFGSEIPRFVQESWGKLGYWFLVLAENAF
jgi:hypothetical protein